MIVARSKLFDKDYALIIKQGKDIELVNNLILALSDGSPLDQRYRNHKLLGKYQECYECHVKPDLLLIYQIDLEDQILYLVRVGSHSRLF